MGNFVIQLRSGMNKSIMPSMVYGLLLMILALRGWFTRSMILAFFVNPLILLIAVFWLICTSIVGFITSSLAQNKPVTRALYALATAVIIAVAVIISSVSYDTHFYRIFHASYIVDVLRDYLYWIIIGAHFLMFWLGEEIGNGCRKERDAVNAAKEENHLEIKS
ncbi:hypothetical protein [Butyrivibrio fibrisolvens]|uniref:hypothetical protein n=1 Tax=Butyrivibrio fibrisolvens TaxID=831 RepID=UPI000485C0D6|nr:hypothetical protein [Butyrivibrio fibrisolvens]